MLRGTALVMGHNVELHAGPDGYSWRCDNDGVLAAVNAEVPPNDLRYNEGHPAAALLKKLGDVFDCQVRHHIPIDS